ncbi:PAS domain S-box protein [Maribacter sp. PR1]|uniref:PAS domain S-box protein n=1 Tax=Maribacter cobaltidurans TaxID=1178778 RepID=A0ABU7IRD0_9FLAO|nr:MULTISPECIES: PAS domain S-box protein [Maribacter]MDC6388131.1 PAS domain S-box protein [Maribacter sp. PR1]MEE1975519.1 PAS domain S-box protein [Maribacter cobaltidurans]
MMADNNVACERLRLLDTLEIMDSIPEKVYDDITSLAASICGTPVSLITLLGEKRQYFKSHHGVGFNETQIEVSICKHLVDDDIDKLIVEDLRKDNRFKNNPMVAKEPGITFYAGVPLTWSNGVRLGSLCVIDSQPKKISTEQVKALKTLAQQVIQLLELRKAKKEVDQKNEELEKILSSSLDVICTVDREGTFMQINNACKKIWGYKPKELIGQHLMDFVYRKDIPITQKSTEATISGKKTLNFENRYIHKDGSLVSVLWSANWDERDELMYCVAKDITERKKVRLQLEHSERRFKTLVQEGGELIAILDEDANYSYVSPTSTKILQIEPEEFIGTNAFDYIHPEDQESVFNQFKEILQKSQIKIEPFRFKNKAGNWRWVETIVTNQKNEPSLNGIVANSRDVTERIAYLKAIEEQNARLREIAWTQSHVFRAPVARLMGLIELIKDKEIEFDEKDEILNFIIISAQEIDTIIKNIVENSANKIELEDLK